MPDEVQRRLGLGSLDKVEISSCCQEKMGPLEYRTWSYFVLGVAEDAEDM